MEIVIEKGVPYHCSAQTGFAASLLKMEVGESFLFPTRKRSQLSGPFRKLAPKKFSTRTVDEENVRVWRIA